MKNKLLEILAILLVVLVAILSDFQIDGYWIK